DVTLAPACAAEQAGARVTSSAPALVSRAAAGAAASGTSSVAPPPKPGEGGPPPGPPPGSPGPGGAGLPVAGVEFSGKMKDEGTHGQQRYHVRESVKGEGLPPFEGDT